MRYARRETHTPLIPAAILAGLLALLYAPFAGKLATEVLAHAALHALEHRGYAGIIVAILVMPTLVVAAVVLLCLRMWWGAADVGLVLLIVRRLIASLDH
jgi:hypothetical protein